jgi:transposase-like protein
MSKQAHWYSLIRDQDQSGLTITGYCTSKGIKPCTFHYWRRRYRQGQHTSAGFVELKAPAPAPHPIRLSYPNGVNIDLPAVDISLIAQLLRLG